MNNFVTKALTALPNMAQNMQFSLSLSGAPAAVAVGLACGFGTIAYGIHEWGKHDERMMMMSMPQPLDEQMYQQLMGNEVATNN